MCLPCGIKLTLLIITDVKKFVERVAEQLLTEKAKNLRGPFSNLGLIPVSQLSVHFPQIPPPVLVSCLERLQYGFKIEDSTVFTEDRTKWPDVKATYLFFPALLEGDRSEVKWIISGGGVCTLGWYLSCKERCTFPPRFMYSLLLKLASEYCDLHSDDGVDHTPHRGICIRWNNGIYWLAESGTEGFVKESRGVVVMVRNEHDLECGKILSSVVRNISNLCKKLCHTLVTTEYFLNPKELQGLSSPPEIDSLQLYLMRDVKRVMSEEKMVISECRKGCIAASDIGFLKQYPLWGKSEK